MRSRNYDQSDDGILPLHLLSINDQGKLASLSIWPSNREGRGKLQATSLRWAVVGLVGNLKDRASNAGSDELAGVEYTTIDIR